MSDATEPEALKPYEIRVKPNWFARTGLAMFLLLVAFMAINGYRTNEENHRLLLQARADRVAADQDRRQTVQQLSVVEDQLQQAIQKGTVSAHQVQVLVDVIKSLEDQVVRLGGTPVVPPQITSMSPTSFTYTPSPSPQAQPTGRTASASTSGGHATHRPSPSPSTTSKGTRSPSPSPTETSPMPSTTPPPPPHICVLTICVVL